MIERKTTLVLGAGASVALGYPLGFELRQQILNLRGDWPSSSFLSVAGIDQRELLDFINAFEKSQFDSIDAFLARRPEFGPIGKQAIAALLLRAETLVPLHRPSDSDPWYSYLLNRLLPDSWEELNFKNLSVVTFNYDRSLEHYLLQALQSAYDHSQDAVLEKLRKLKVVHVYGSLGPNLPGHPDYLPYGVGASPERVKLAAEWIRVIPEGRIDDHSLQDARVALHQAQAIGFLGFGFDSINSERLQLPQTSANLLEEGGSRRRRPVVATCLGLTEAEALDASRLIDTAANGLEGRYPRGFRSANCLTMLRETLLLSR